MRLFLTGASGNVGKTIVRSLPEHPEFELVGGWCLESGCDIGVLAGLPPIGVKVSETLKDGLESSKPDIVIDFSVSTVLKENLKTYAEMKLDAVVGATGLTEDEIRSFGETVGANGLRWSIIPNYCIGMAFVRDIVEKLRPFYPYVSVTDRHPATMANAPSGTAVKLARTGEGESGKIASGETHGCVLGHDENGVKIHSVRMPYPGPYAEHEVMLGRKDEVITINIKDFSSGVYMDGVFRTAKFLKNAPAGTFLRDVPTE